MEKADRSFSSGCITLCALSSCIDNQTVHIYTCLIVITFLSDVTARTAEVGEQTALPVSNLPDNVRDGIVGVAIFGIW